MGTRITVDGQSVEVDGYSVQESSTPSNGGDTSGSVGSIGTAFPSDPLQILWSNKPVTLEDTRQGSTLGRAFSINANQGSGLASLDAVSRLGDLAIRNVQAQPFVGTLGGAFEYYLGLAGITTDFIVQGGTTVEDRPVAYPGWYGELWNQLKLLCTVEHVEIALVSGNIIMRPVASRIARNDRNAERTISVNAQQLAQRVEVYNYSNTAITDEIVYPVAGSDPQILQVAPGETIETTLQLSASLSAVEQPTVALFVPRGGTGASEYTVIGDDNLPIPTAAWTANGGSLTLAIQPDTTSVVVTLTGATGLGTDVGAPINSFRIALSDDENTYNTLYFRGTGVLYDKQLYSFRTGVTEAQTSQEVGIQIDNPLVSSLEQVYRVGTTAARQYTGRKVSMSGTVTAINRRGDTGTVNYPTYDYVDDELATGLSYDDLQAEPAFSGQTYNQVQTYLYSLVQDDFENQVFGNTGGARIWDEPSRRWFRIREATITPGGITIGNADDNLLHSDMQSTYAATTYNQLQTRFDPYSYDESNLLGAYVG